jgi:hypothetical protein
MNGSSHLESVTLMLDVLLIALSFWMAVIAARLRLGGAIGKTVGYVVSGSIVLGFAHFIETFATRYGIANEHNEILHRLIVLAGILLLTLGVRALASAMAARKNT